MKICYFGTYDSNFAKNKFIIRALGLNGVEVVEIHKQIPITQLNTKKHLSLWLLLKRIFVKFSIVPIAARNYSLIKSCGGILVGYPGHFDVPFAAVVSKLTGVPLFFDPVLILTKTFTEGVPMFTTKSLVYKILRFVEGRIYSLPKLIFTETEYTRNLLASTFNIPQEKIKIVYLGADDSIYKRRARPAGGKFIIAYYGMFIRIHGVPVILGAAERLKRYADIEFQLIGRGPLYDETVQTVKKKRLTNVTLLPDVNESNAFLYLVKSSVFLGFLTNSDLVQRTIPNKVYQGLALGRAVITADTRIIRLHFTDGQNMMLVKPNNPAELARAILRLRNNPKQLKEIENNGYDLFKQRYSPQAIGGALKKYINAAA